MCDENGFGGDGEYSGDNDAQLDLINVFYYWASYGMYVPRADHTRGKLGQRPYEHPYQKVEH
jgi:thiamine kinase-like enzyme